MEDFRAFLRQHSYPDNFPLNGQWHRFDRTRPESGFFKGTVVTNAGNQYVHATFGDWAADEKYNWSSPLPLEASEAKQVASEYERLMQESVEERRLQAERVAKECGEKWERLSTLGTTPYLDRKKINQLCGARIEATGAGLELIVPCRDIDGRLWGLQRILPDGSKYFTQGQRIKGCFHLMGQIDPKGTIYVAEGFATSASIFMSGQGLPVVSAFNAGNLPAVAGALRERYPAATLVICADNDAFTTRRDGSPWNPGLEKASLAADRCGGTLRVPSFPDPLLDRRPTDFNDLHVLCSLDEVARQLAIEYIPVVDAGALTPGSDEDLWYGVPVATLPPKCKTLPQQLIADHVGRWFGGRLIKQERDLFLHQGTHWQHLEPGEHDRIKVVIQRACGGKASASQVDAIFKLFMYHAPTPPEGVDMFSPHPNCANFRNGTLWVIRTPSQEYALEFREHSPEDYLINVLPYDYDETSTERNEEFLSMLDRVFEGDPDKEEKIRAVGQMYGACLISLWPQLFMLYGPPATGKSSVMLIAARLVHKTNLCSVDPTQFEGFNMESMSGKLVNIDTDIDITRPISDSQVKKIIDRRPFRIRRKGIKDLDAPIPATHIFGGNDIPRTLEGANRAHDRRWTFVEFAKFVPKGQYDKEYHDYCYEVSPQGVLNFAVAGLRDLCASRGHFIKPASGTAKMADWQLNSDPVGQFLKDLEEGELLDEYTKAKRDEKGRLLRSSVWQMYKIWSEDSFGKMTQLGKKKFFDSLRSKGIVEKRNEKGRYFEGFSLGSGSESGF